MTNEAQIQATAVQMVAFASKGRKVSKAEKIELMTWALGAAEAIVAKQAA